MLLHAKSFRRAARWVTALFLLSALLLPGCKGELGSRDNPVKLMVVPAQDRDATRAAARSLAHALEESTGLAVTVEVPETYIDMVAALGSAEADVVLMNDMAYLLAHERYGATAALAVERGTGDQSYNGAIIARADSGIRTLADLEGKTVAYVDVHSVSGYILPARLLHDRGITLSESRRAGNHGEVVRMVYEGQVDAGFTFAHDHPGPDGEPLDGRIRVAGQLHDVFEKVVIVATTEAVPNEPIVFRKGVPDEVRHKVVEALLDYVKTSEGQQVFGHLNEITGLHRVSDDDYDGIREALGGLEQKLDELVPGGGLLDLKRRERVVPMPPLGD